MRIIILALMFSGALGAKTVFFRTSKGYSRKEISQDDKKFASQFYEKCTQRAVRVTASALEDYEPKKIEEPVTVADLDDFLFYKTGLEMMFRRIFLPKMRPSTGSNEIVPVFKVEYDGNEIKETEIVHNGLEYVANCSICIDFCQDPRIICINKHSFCSLCLEQLNEKSGGIKSCPTCRGLPKSMTYELNDDLEKQIRIDLCRKFGRTAIFSFLAVVASVPYFLHSEFTGAGLINALGFAFQMLAINQILVILVMYEYRFWRGQQISTYKWKILALLNISNIWLGIATIGGWTTFSGFILMFPVLFILMMQFTSMRNMFNVAMDSITYYLNKFHT